MKQVKSLTPTISRRRMCQIGLGGLASLSFMNLAACGGGGSADGKTQIEFFFWGSVSRDKLTQEAIKSFEEKNSNINISSQFLPFDQYWNRLNTQIAGGNAPDVIQMDMRYLLQFQQQNIIKDLSPYISDKTIDLSDFDQTMLASSEIDGKHYAISLGDNHVALVYNSTMVNDLNIEIPDTLTWEEYADLSVELSNALGDGKFGAADISDRIPYFEIWVRQRGKELYTPDGQLAFAVEDIEDWYNYWLELHDKGGSISMSAMVTAGNDLAQSPITTGDVATAVNLSNFLESMQTYTEDTLALAATPTGEQPGMYLKPSQLICITESSQYPQECAEFISALITDPDAVKALGLDRGVPGSAKAREVLTPQLSPVQQEVMRFVEFVSQTPSLTRAKKVLDPAGAGKVESEFLRHAQEVGLRKISAKDGAKSTFDDLQKALNV